MTILLSCSSAGRIALHLNKLGMRNHVVTKRVVKVASQQITHAEYEKHIGSFKQYKKRHASQGYTNKELKQAFEMYKKLMRDLYANSGKSNPALLGHEFEEAKEDSMRNIEVKK